VQRDGDKIELDTLFPDLGEYVLRVYAKRKSDKGPYECAIEYAVQVDSTECNTLGFPTALATFQEKDAHLYTPLCSCLKSGTTETFKISAPGAVNVVVIVNGKFIQLTKNGDVFEGKVAISGSDVKIAARFPESESYMVLLKYSVS